jgi:NADH:ubiquinone oxidoreductase subunit 6 (subunit J)
MSAAFSCCAFAVMLTIASPMSRSPTRGRAHPALIVVGVLVYLWSDRAGTPWTKAKEIVFAATTAKIGDLFLDTYLLPFELASLVLLAALIGAVFSRKEIKE